MCWTMCFSPESSGDPSKPSAAIHRLVVSREINYYFILNQNKEKYSLHKSHFAIFLIGHTNPVVISKIYVNN